MSVYGTVECKMTDLDTLMRAIEMADLGLTVNVKQYAEGNGVYRKFNARKFCEGGSIRGKDAHIVIHGGLDTSGLYAGGRYGGSGDTAFVQHEDGSIEAHIDINWHNGPANWQKIQGLYAYLRAKEKADRAGLHMTYEVHGDGTITGQIVEPRGVSRQAPTRTTHRQSKLAGRPQPVRS